MLGLAALFCIAGIGGQPFFLCVVKCEVLQELTATSCMD
jgi:hypothetical protein